MTGRQLFIRTSLTAALPFILIWAFVETLGREIKSAFWYARNEVQQNIAAYREMMKREDY
jgi:hypothetical protein